MGDVHVSRIASALGEPAPLAELPEVVAAGSGPLLEKEGLSRCRVSTYAPWELAAEAARTTVDGVDVDAVVYATDTFDGEPADKGPSRFLEAVGLPRTPTFGVALRGCANLGGVLETARNLVLAGRAGTVLAVTTDTCRPGRRLMGANLSVLSDGAATCLVSAHPDPGGSFRLSAVASTVEAGMHTLSIATDTMATVKATADGVARVARTVFAATGVGPADVTHVVTHNYGRSAVRILAAATRIPLDAIWQPTAAEVGHCFAADTLINLAALGVAPGRRPLLLMSGTNVWSCALLEA